MASVSTSAPEYALQVPPVPNGTNANGMTLARSQAKTIIKDMATRTWSSAKSFGKIAALYSGSECLIESVRIDASEWLFISFVVV